MVDRLECSTVRSWQGLHSKTAPLCLEECLHLLPVEAPCCTRAGRRAGCSNNFMTLERTKQHLPLYGHCSIPNWNPVFLRRRRAVFIPELHAGAAAAAGGAARRIHLRQGLPDRPQRPAFQGQGARQPSLEMRLEFDKFLNCDIHSSFKEWLSHDQQLWTPSGFSLPTRHGALELPIVP